MHSCCSGSPFEDPYQPTESKLKQDNEAWIGNRGPQEKVGPASNECVHIRAIVETATGSLLPVPLAVQVPGAKSYLELWICHICTILGRHTARGIGGGRPAWNDVEATKGHSIHHAKIIAIWRIRGIFPRLLRHGPHHNWQQHVRSWRQYARWTPATAASLTTRGSGLQPGRGSNEWIMSGKNKSSKCNVCLKRVHRHSYVQDSKFRKLCAIACGHKRNDQYHKKIWKSQCVNDNNVAHSSHSGLNINDGVIYVVLERNSQAMLRIQ